MALDLHDYVASIPDYPEKGVIFRDISPLMGDGNAYKEATNQIVDYARNKGVEMIVGPEARDSSLDAQLLTNWGLALHQLVKGSCS